MGGFFSDTCYDFTSVFVALTSPITGRPNEQSAYSVYRSVTETVDRLSINFVMGHEITQGKDMGYRVLHQRQSVGVSTSVERGDLDRKLAKFCVHYL